MLYTSTARRMGTIAIGLAAFAVQMGHAETTQTATEERQLQEMPELTMASHFIGVPYNCSGVSVSIINPELSQKRGIETLTGALSQTPGVFNLDCGGTWQRGSVSNTVIRGMNRETYTLTMIDGMRISDVNMSGNKMLGITSLFTVGHAEVVKGAQGAVFGSGAIGGVVSMDTPQGTDEQITRIFTEVGSFGTFNSHLTSSGKIDKLSYFVGLGYETTENDPTIYNDIYTNRTGMNDFRQWQGAVRLNYEINDKVNVDFTYRGVDSYFEYPTPYVDYNSWPATIDPHLYNTEDRNHSNLVTAKINAELNDTWTTSFMLGYYNMNYSVHTPEYDFQPNMMSNRRTQIEWRNALKWNDTWTTVAGIAWDRSDYKSANNYVCKDEWQSTLAFFAEQMWSPSESFDASLALRLEHDSVWNNHFTWRYSNSWKVTGKDSPTRIFASVGTGFRAPTYFERHINAYGYIGNPNLDISESIGGDIGIEQKLGENHSMTVTGFWTRIEDEIGESYQGVWPNSYSTFENYSHCTSYGVELAFKGEFNDAWNSGYTANYTFTMPKRNEAGTYATRQMANTARHTINAELHTSPTEKLTLGIGATAAMKRTDYNYEPLDGFFTARLFARYQLTDNVQLHARIENLFDQNYIMTNDYNFGPRQARGLGFFGGVTIEF